MAAKGFWSYVHKDDDVEHGRITRLARDIVDQYELVTGESIDLFLDRDAIQWGDKWRDKIDDSLSSVAFFIPVLSPRYFQRPECRQELQFFGRRAKELGVTELVMPLLYVDVPALHVDQPADDAIELVKLYQWRDWTELRFADPTSPEYRKAVAELAKRIVTANERAQETAITEVAEKIERTQVDGDENEPGLVDKLARAEEEIPQWIETMQAMTTEVEQVGALFSESTQEILNGRGQGKEFANRQAVARKLGFKLQQPASRLVQLGNGFTSQLHTVDTAIRLVIDRAPAEIEHGSATTEQVCEFYSGIRNLAQAARAGLSSLQEMVDGIDAMQNLSRDLRPPLKKLRQGLALVVEGRSLTDDWVRLLEASPVECNSPAERVRPAPSRNGIESSLVREET